MNVQNNLLIVIFLFVSFLIWQNWEIDFNNVQSNNIEKLKNINNEVKKINNFTEKNNQEKITVSTDVLSLIINTYGGDIEEAHLLKYSDQLGLNQPLQLLKNTPEFIYQAQSELVGLNSSDDLNKTKRLYFTTEKKNYTLPNNENELHVVMHCKDKNGIFFTKTFILERGKYSIKVNYHISNKTQVPLELSMFGQLKQTVDIPKNSILNNSNFALHTFRGAAYSTNTSKYEKYKFNTILKNKNLDVQSKNGWIAMLQQYFATAWIPLTNNNTLYTEYLGNNIVAIGYKSDKKIIYPHTKNSFSAILWIGPEIQHSMAMIAPYLDLTVDYGWLWFIAQPLFKLLKLLHSFIHNWGISIIIITFIVRGIMYPITKVQYTSAAKIRILQPKIKLIREKFGDNKQRLSQEMMNLYKSEKLNPLGGCLPLLIQMPIFLALYYMLMSSVELRHAPFILWITDLSSQDPYYILPIIMGFSMFVIQKMSPNTITDPIQKKIMNYMPIIFTMFFLWFPSGLVLYYIISNLVTIIQQYWIYKKLNIK